jgi:hypothetical protein
LGAWPQTENPITPTLPARHPEFSKTWSARAVQFPAGWPRCELSARKPRRPVDKTCIAAIRDRPNIRTIYEVRQSEDDRVFIVMVVYPMKPCARNSERFRSAIRRPFRLQEG